MNQSTKATAIEVAKRTLYVVNPMLGSLLELTTSSVAESERVEKTGELDKLRAEAERLDLSARIAERHAKVAQEIALARRIETAEEVEMEEYYDYKGAGHAGLNADESTISIGAGGEGQRVSKRIFRFKGRTDIITVESIPEAISDPSDRERLLVTMAEDPEIQRELRLLNAEFAGTERDGLDEAA